MEVDGAAEELRFVKVEAAKEKQKRGMTVTTFKSGLRTMQKILFGSRVGKVRELNLVDFTGKVWSGGLGKLITFRMHRMEGWKPFSLGRGIREASCSRIGLSYSSAGTAGCKLSHRAKEVLCDWNDL